MPKLQLFRQYIVIKFDIFLEACGFIKVFQCVLSTSGSVVLCDMLFAIFYDIP